ncbi:3737_t:CDS:1 [Entrophospora sp. SA101]|nr:3737_t:CDS:1 [Entrophospora sp. SA101]
MSCQLQLTCGDDFERLLNSMQIFPIPHSRSVLDLIKTRSPERMCSKVSNSYFVYRKVINDELKDRSIKLPMAVTSALTSYGWNKASPEVKYAYEQLSKECEKNLNLRRNKELVWNPKPKESKNKKKTTRKSIKHPMHQFI